MKLGLKLFALFALIGIAIFVYFKFGQNKEPEIVNGDELPVAPLVVVYSGTARHFFEGESSINYIVTAPKDVAVAPIVEETFEKGVEITRGVDKVRIYFSYEGGRGFTPKDFVEEFIVPNFGSVTYSSSSPVNTSVLAENEAWVTVKQGGNVSYIGQSIKSDYLVTVTGFEGSSLLENIVNSLVLN